MPFAQHPLLKAPENSTSKIWRYMDIPKFISLLEEKALYFSSVKNFFDDPYEGSVTRATIEKMQKTSMGAESLRKLDDAKKLIYVSCWHLNDDESAAMWRQYANLGPGVAIQSTVKLAQDALKDAQQDVSMGLVSYDIDYYTEEISRLNLFILTTNKRRHFKADQEIRFIIMAGATERGHLVKVDLDSLVERIYISPNSPQWVYDLIYKLLKRYQLNKELKYSQI